MLSVEVVELPGSFLLVVCILPTVRHHPYGTDWQQRMGWILEVVEMVVLQVCCCSLVSFLCSAVVAAFS